MSDSQAELRKRWKAACRAYKQGHRVSLAGFDDLRCGAKTRAGTPCKRRDLWDSGRCRLHGGLSTGPKSGPRKKIEHPVPPPEPYNPWDNPEFVEIMRRQGVRL